MKPKLEAESKTEVELIANSIDLFTYMKVVYHYISLQLPEGRHTLVVGPIKRYPGLQINATDSPVQYPEPSFFPFIGKPESPQLIKAYKKK